MSERASGANGSPWKKQPSELGPMQHCGSARILTLLLGVGAAPVLTPTAFWFFLIQGMPWAALVSVVMVYAGVLVVSRT